MDKKGIARNILVLILVIVILIAGLLGTVAYFITRPAAPPTGEVAIITGIARDAATNLTIAGATVSAGGYTTVSGSNGNYTVAVPLGNYSLTVTFSGYQTYTTSVSATQAQT